MKRPGPPPIRRQDVAGGRPKIDAGREVKRLLAEGVRHHQRGQMERAAHFYRLVLQLAPRQADALHLLGLAVDHQGDHDRALALIGQAIAIDPRPAPYHNSLGVVLLSLGRLSEAETSFRAALARDPLYPEASNNLGNALVQQQRLEEAIPAYDRAVEVRPDYAEAWCNRGRSLHLLDRAADAVDSFERALALRPGWPKALRYHGDALGAQGQRDQAESRYRQAAALDPADAETPAALAALLERANRLDEALAAAEQALALAPRDLRAAVTLARTLRRQNRLEDGLRRLDDLAGYEADDETMSSAAFERAQILDRLGRYDQAYAAYAEGNTRLAGTAAARRVDRAFFPELIERLRRRFTRDWVASWTPPPAKETVASPVFLIGFPRSGTTLLDQILDAHPALSTMEEKDAIDVVRREVDRLPGGYPDALADLSGSQIERLRRLYFAEVTRHLGDLGPRILVDKMPLNTIDLGLIHRLFPDARILAALRHPCDVVLSGFMQAMKPNAAMVLFDGIELHRRLLRPGHGAVAALPRGAAAARSDGALRRSRR